MPDENIASGGSWWDSFTSGISNAWNSAVNYVDETLSDNTNDYINDYTDYSSEISQATDTLNNINSNVVSAQNLQDFNTNIGNVWKDIKDWITPDTSALPPNITNFTDEQQLNFMNSDVWDNLNDDVKKHTQNIWTAQKELNAKQLQADKDAKWGFEEWGVIASLGLGLGGMFMNEYNRKQDRKYQEKMNDPVRQANREIAYHSTLTAAGIDQYGRPINSGGGDGSNSGGGIDSSHGTNPFLSN